MVSPDGMVGGTKKQDAQKYTGQLISEILRRSVPT